MSSNQKSSSAAAHKAANDNKANQCNPNHSEFGGHQQGYTGKGTKEDLVNHAKQLNPNNSLHRPPGNK
jgi:hypothetical protein